MPARQPANSEVFVVPAACGTRPVIIGWAIVVIAMAGLLPHVFFASSHQFHTLRKFGSDAIDPRYAAAARELPPDREVGFVSDAPTSTLKGARLFSHAQYSFAPRLVLDTDKMPHVIVNLADPRRLDEVCRLHGLNAVAIFPGGVAIAVPSVRR